MINITDPKAKQRVQLAVDRQITIFERIHLNSLIPILNRQFIDSAKLVRASDMNIDSQIDKQVRRMRANFIDRFTRVNAIFGLNIFQDIDKVKFVSRPITMKDAFGEFQQNMQLFISQLAAKKVTFVTKTTKKIIRDLISKGVADGLSNRDIAKNILKAGRITNPFRAITIAKTETHTMAVKSMQTGIKASRIKMEEEWVSSIDDRTRGREEGEFKHIQTFPNGANGERIKQGDLFVGTGERLKFPGDPDGSAGNIINCFTSSRTPIYTSIGWKKIIDLKIGDLVLTHKNRFKKVLRLFNDSYHGDLIQIRIEGTSSNKISVTPEHPFLVSDGTWREAKNICKGDKIEFLAAFCQRCGKPTRYNKKYCSRTCLSKDITDRQWNNPKHRANMSKKASVQLHREYENGTRDKNEIVKKARHVCFKKYGKGGVIAALINTSAFREKIKKGVEKKYGSYLNMLKLKAFPALGKCNFKGSKLEKAMSIFLVKKGKKFIPQFVVGRRRIDFYVGKEKLFIECDGSQFHKDEKRERKRDLEILNQYPDHKIAHVTYKTNPPKWEYFDLLSLNHSGTFSHLSVKVESITTKKLKNRIRIYNFAVEDDESYVVKGFITHNCRCVEIFHTV